MVIEFTQNTPIAGITDLEIEAEQRSLTLSGNSNTPGAVNMDQMGSPKLEEEDVQTDSSGQEDEEEPSSQSSGRMIGPISSGSQLRRTRSQHAISDGLDYDKD